MPKFYRIPLYYFACVVLCSGLNAQTAPAAGAAENTKAAEDIVVMEKFVAGQSNDPNGVLPPPNEMFGLSKAIIDIPRSVSTVSGDMVEKFNINELVDLARFVPSTYTTFSFGIQGGISVRGSNGDAYYRDMKRINNGPNMPTLIGASDGVDIVRGPPSSVYGAGQVGGYMNYKPKSARASTGRYMDTQSGKVSTTFGSWGKRSGTAEIGGPLKLFGKRAGYYAYGQIDNSDSYYIGSYNRNQILQATLTVDLTDDFRLETGINYQNFHGTGLAGWSRVTQDLIDNRNYVSGVPLRNLDTDGDGLASFLEIYNVGNLNITTPASGLKPTLTPADLFSLDPATVRTVKLSPRNVLLEKDAFGRDHIFFVDLVHDRNPNLIFRNKIFVEQQSHEKASDIAYYREHEAFVAEERFSVQYTPTFLPEWLKVATVTSINARYLDTYNASTNIYQIFNYWDVSRYTDGNYGFANGLHNPELANYQGRIGAASGSAHVEAGIGTLIDISAFGRLNLTVGGRLDTVYGRVENYPGFSVSNRTTNAAGANSGNALTLSPYGFFKGSDRKYSLTSVSLSYEIIKGVRPYVTYAQPRTIVPGASGGLSSGTLTGTEILQPSELKELGIKGEFFGGKLFVAASTFEQFRSSYNTTLEEYVNTISDGTDVEVRWVPTRKFNISAAVDWIRRRTSPPSALGVQVPPATAGYDPITHGLGRYNITLPAAASERSYSPPQVWSVFANYAIGRGFDISVGTSRQGSFPSSNLHDIILPAAQTFSGSVGYTSRQWDVRVSGRNLTDVLYFQANSGSAGPIPNVGRSIDCKVTWKF